MPAKNVLTISPLLPFADTLAAGLLELHKNDPSELARTVIFLPTRRACKTLHDAFLRQSDGKPLLLPRLIPFGAIDEEETVSALALFDEEDSLPPSISPLRRRLLLMRLIQQKQTEGITTEQALQLADALAVFLDESYIESVDFNCLKTLVPDEFAVHWQDTLLFLEIITSMWPKILKEEGVIDAVDRQVRLFKSQAKHWRENPPDFPIIAAGSTGSQPATAELLDAIASLPNGTVILPGLDRMMEGESFDAVEPSHPQYNLKHLLDTMGITREDVRPYGTEKPKCSSERFRLISEAMRPALTTENWRTMEKVSVDALDGITRIDCQSSQEEALTIAMILRETLETPAKTAALITPDRSLARRVVAEMNRWGVVMDDSAGTNLALTPLGTYISLLGIMALNNLAPFDLLACLKHPLAAGGKDFGTFRHLVRRLERNYLRGKRQGDGFDGLEKAVSKEDSALTEFVQDLKERFGGFADLMQDGTPRPFEIFLNAHLSASESLAQSADRVGAERLWIGEAGQSAVSLITDLKDNAALMADVTPMEYLAVLTALMRGIAVRPKYGMHPRLDILGTMEARLIQPDVVILSGLNEGTWPKNVTADPWLSRPMRENCGLSSPERKIALSAHDFVQAFCAPTVILTRSVKDGGTPTVPSRWLMRLDAVLSASDLTWPVGNWMEWSRQLDMPKAVLSFQPPKPNPPVDARPRRLSITKIETWMRDPYSIYAQYILGLKPLEDIDEDLNIADYGTLLHKAVEEFCIAYPNKLPADVVEKILKIGEEQMAGLNFSAKATAFWKPRIRAALEWFIDRQKERIYDIERIYCEQSGEIIIKADGGDFKLTGIADRIDVMKDGTARIIDYKVGTPPSENTVIRGYAPQLPLEAAMIARGGFKAIGKRTVETLEYWRLRGAKDGGFIRSIPLNDKAKSDAEKFIEEQLNLEPLSEQYFDRLKELIDTYDNPETSYLATPDTSVSLTYNDYDHLARFAEWATLDTDAEGEE